MRGRKGSKHLTDKMYRKLRLLPSLGNTALSIALICSLLLHSACSVDEEDFKYCNWHDTERCPEDDVRTIWNWECLAEVFECAYGKQLHCARHYTNRSKMIFGCAMSKECLPGEAPYLDKIERGKPTDEFHVTCADCHDKEHFNDMKKNSSTYAECQEKTKCDPEHGIECNPVDINRKDVYKRNRECRCNTFEDYTFGESLEGSVCTSDKSIANHCYHAGSCGNGMERVQNGTCVPKCEQGHRTKYSDECIKDPETTSSSQNPQFTDSNAEIQSTPPSTSPPQTVITTDWSTTIQSSTTDKHDPISIDVRVNVFPVLLGVFSIIMLIVTIVIGVRWFHERCQRENQSGVNVRYRRKDKQNGEEGQALSNAVRNQNQTEASEADRNGQHQTNIFCETYIHAEDIEAFQISMDGNRKQEQTKDRDPNVRFYPTKRQENENKRKPGGLLPYEKEPKKKNVKNSDESSEEESTKMHAYGSRRDLLQNDQASDDKPADQSNTESISTPEGGKIYSSTAITDTAPFQELRNAEKLKPLSLLKTLSSKSNFEEFLKEVKSIEGLLQSFKEITNPDISSEFYEPDQNKYCPENFQRLISTGDGNCLFNSISILLFGNEDFARYLRLVATIAAAKNREVLIKDALAKNASEESEADITDKVYKDIMSTAVDKEYMDRPHVQFLSTAIKRIIVQHYQNKRLATAITGDQNQDTDTVYPIFSETDGNEDRNKDLHILWVNSDGDTSRGEDHIVPLLIKGNSSR